MEPTACADIHLGPSVGLGSKRKRYKYADNHAACCAMSNKVLSPTQEVLCLMPGSVKLWQADLQPANGVESQSLHSS